MACLGRLTEMLVLCDRAEVLKLLQSRLPQRDHPIDLVLYLSYIRSEKSIGFVSFFWNHFDNKTV